MEIHLILDYGSLHVANVATAWLPAHPRFHVHHTPQACQLAQSSRAGLFNLTRRLLRRGQFATRDELVAKIMAWIAEYDRTAKPFAWTYEGKPLKGCLNHTLLAPTRTATK